jgi:adenosylcobinamide kinase/adenosylcobinamide-phosphate guanylyltransferase
LREREPAELERKIREEAIQLVRQAQRGDVIAVTNEVGSGLVPQDIVGRRFRDLQGFVNQQIARAADTVYLLVSGIPVRIKPGNGVNQ